LLFWKKVCFCFSKLLVVVASDFFQCNNYLKEKDNTCVCRIVVFVFQLSWGCAFAGGVAGFSYTQENSNQQIDTIKEMILSLGENPEQLLTQEALSRGNITELNIEDHQVRVLTEELKKLIHQSADSTNAHQEWCYGQDLNLRTPEGKDFPYRR
jgi:hypothetical protein